MVGLPQNGWNSNNTSDHLYRLILSPTSHFRIVRLVNLTTNQTKNWNEYRKQSGPCRGRGIHDTSTTVKWSHKAPNSFLKFFDQITECTSRYECHITPTFHCGDRAWRAYQSSRWQLGCMHQEAFKELIRRVQREFLQTTTKAFEKLTRLLNWYAELKLPTGYTVTTTFFQPLCDA